MLVFPLYLFGIICFHNRKRKCKEKYGFADNGIDFYLQSLQCGCTNIFMLAMFWLQTIKIEME